MAHFVRLRPSGFWTIASVVTPAEFEAFDENLSKAINGDDGGTWAPSAQIVIGGSGLRVTGPSRLDDATRIDVSGLFVLEASSSFEQLAGGTGIFYGSVQVKDAAASLDVLGGAALTIDSTAAPSVIESELRMESGADVRLGTNSELKTTNARNCRILIPLTIRSRLETVGPGAANSFPIRWGYGNIADAYPGLPIQEDITTPEEWVAFALPHIPSSATIVTYQAAVAPTVAARAAVPVTPPAVRLVRYDSNGVRTIVSSTQDTTATVPGYEIPHSINGPTIAEAAVDNWYVLEVRGEHNGNSVTGLQLLRLAVNYTTTRVNHQVSEVALS